MHIKRKLSAGAAAFMLSLLFLVTLCGFISAEHNMRELGFAEYEPMAQLTQREDGSVYFSFMGLDADIPAKVRSDAAFYAQRLSVLIPARIRLAAQLAAAALGQARA